LLPFQGREENVEKAKRYCRILVDIGCISIASHVYFSQFMDDRNLLEGSIWGIMRQHRLCLEVFELDSYKDLEKLAELIKRRIEIDSEIARIINRPAERSHVGEFIASRIFDIELEESATNKGFDGYFRSGKLAGKTANIKWYGKNEYELDINENAVPGYYLVMTGEHSPPGSSKGKTRPWVISYVYLFNAKKLIEELKRAGVKIGIATSVRKKFWDEAEIYPRQKSKELILTEKQRELLRLFSA